MIATLALIGAIWLVVVVTVVRCRRLDGRAPADDIGCWWLLILALYATLPPLSWILQGQQYTPLSPRLYSAAPTVDDVRFLLLIALTYALGFACVYLPIRGASARLTMKIRRIPTSHMLAAAAIFIASASATSAVWVFSERPSSYTDFYRVVAGMPLAVRQFLKVAGSMGQIASLVVLVAILQRWPHRRWLLLAYVALVLSSYDPSGSRSAVALHLLALAIGWHVLVRPIRLGAWIMGGTLGLGVFVAAGILRSLAFGQLGAAELAGIGLGEFDNLWANALELLPVGRGSAPAVPATTRFAELWAFVPSQLLPFKKTDLSGWFLHNYWLVYSEAGGGLAFGALSQAVIGGGVAEAAIRGVLIGIIAGLAFRWLRSTTPRWWTFPAYLWLLTDLIQSIRNTTFSQLSDLIQVLIPSMLFIGALGTVLSVVGQRPRAPTAGPERSSLQA